MNRVLLPALSILLFSGCGGDPNEDSSDEDGTNEDSENSTDTDPANQLCPFEAGAAPDGADWVNGDLIEFNDNGGWCWYQDERVIVDQDNGRLVIGSVASGGDRDKKVEVTHFDLETAESERFVLGTVSYTDDHDAPALILRPDGAYAAMWAGHKDDCFSYTGVFDGDTWETSRFEWPSTVCGTPDDEKITYANLWYVGDTLYSYVRSVGTSPNYISSTDDGLTFELGGRLTTTPKTADDYVSGYYKYWGNNVDRIDFLGTEGHPRTVDNNLWHGYVKKEGDTLKIYNSFDEVIDEDATDGDAKNINEYSPVLAAGTEVNGIAMTHLWNSDLVRYDDGTIAAIGSARKSGSIGAGDPEKHLLYFRFDGTEWKTTYLAQAGKKLYQDEEDYTGLGALDPDNPQVIYISTPFNPGTGDGEYDGKKEIWKGVTCDDGATFTWEAVTANSTEDNLRPIVPKWNVENTALLWLQGTYTSAQEYDQRVVGIINKLPE
jgi:hypothetical protein